MNTLIEPPKVTIESTKVNDELAGLILSPRAYAEQTELRRAFRWLRENNPVGRVEVEGYDPFWAITKYADIVEISRQNDLFHNGDEGTVLRPRATEDLVRSMRNGSPHLLPSMITMDAPEHPKYRRAIQAWNAPDAAIHGSRHSSSCSGGRGSYGLLRR